MSRSAPAVELPPIAATNKCLAQNNKTSTVGTAEGPCAVRRTPRARDRPRQHQTDTGWTAKQADALCNCAQDNGWPHPMRIADLLKLSDTDLHYMPQVGTCTLRIIREARQMAEQKR